VEWLCLSTHIHSAVSGWHAVEWAGMRTQSTDERLSAR